MRLTPRLSGTTAGLALGTTLAVAAAGALGAYWYSVSYTRGLLGQAHETARTQGELIRTALEHQMLANDQTLISQMIRTFGNQPRVERVALLDRQGVVKVSSVSADSQADFTPGSPTCQACHQFPPAQRMDSRVIDTKDGAVLRTVIPIRNQEKCLGCHDPSHKINGILMLDLNMTAIRAGIDRDVRWITAGTALITLLLIAGIAIIVRFVVLRRLQKFESTARSIAAGDLGQRVPAGGSDTIAWLAQEFNTMADSMTSLVGEVRDERQRLETVINSIDDGIVVLDPERKVIAANQAFLAKTGHVRERVLGCCCRELGSGVCGVGDCPTVACLESHARQVRICERRTADGEVRWEEVHASPIVGASGQIVQVVEVWRDISDRRAAEARLAESHRLASVGLLASGFSHELNTPLGTVLTCVESILRDAKSVDGRADWSNVGDSATIAREQILRCRGITQHFLRLSRGQAAASDIVDLPDALTAVVRLVEPTARAHGVRLVLGPMPANFHVRADEGELQQVIVNLALNAIQASTGAAEVRVEVEGGDPVRIRVIDQGCGIAPEHRTRIFEPFFSLRRGGTGIGLFLSLDFVHHWGGDIVVTSEPGLGSTFEVSVPAVSGAAERRTA